MSPPRSQRVRLVERVLGERSGTGVKQGGEGFLRGGRSIQSNSARIVSGATPCTRPFDDFHRLVNCRHVIRPEDEADGRS